MLDRDCGRVWLNVTGPVEGGTRSFDDVMHAAGLASLGDGWRVVDRGEATEVLTSLLHQELAYSTELRTAPDAAALARQFLDDVAGDDTRFATNTGLPATERTFDAGLVVTGSRGSAVYWVADED